MKGNFKARMLRRLALSAALLAAGIPGALAQGSVVPVQDLLSRAGKRMEDFFQQETGVSSVERVEQTKFNQKGQTVSRKTAEYEYLVLLQLGGNELLTQETRELRGAAEVKASQPLLLTRGFALLALILHPHFQSSFRFTTAAQPDEAALREIAFTHIPGARSPSVLELRGKLYPIPWKGTVWLEESTGLVKKIHAELSEPMGDLGLRTLSADVDYGPVAFNDPTAVLWLPMRASIEARTQRQHWRNLHAYSEYKRFEVSTTIEMMGPRENDRKPDSQ